MRLNLKQSHAIRQIAGLLYSFLPGSSSRSWPGHVSFPSVARSVGVGKYWNEGSKEPAVASLLEQTLSWRPDLFEPLVLAIVRNGLTYRARKKKPVRRDEIESLNGLLLDVGFKFPDLWATGFLDSLSEDAVEKARNTARSIEEVERGQAPITQRHVVLAGLWDRFSALGFERDRQAAGFELEKLLNQVFTLFGLQPRSPFRIVGEQIDGSFILDYETYLVEARWRQDKVSEGDLLGFRGKIEGKSAYTRGVFISINGFSSQAKEAIARGKTPIFFTLDGYDLATVLQSHVDLLDLLRFKLRKLTEEGNMFASARELLASSDT